MIRADRHAGATSGVLEFARWVACGIVVAVAHASIAMAMLPRDDQRDTPAVAGAIAVEFAPEAVPAASTQPDLPPGSEQIQTEAASEQPKPVVETKPDGKAEDRPDDMPPAETSEEPRPETPRLPAPEVVLPVTAPPPPPEPLRQVAQAAVPTTSAPQVAAAQTADVAAATVAGDPTADVSAALAPWKGAIFAKIQRNQRYPAAAVAQREAGTAQVSFVIDRRGRLLSSEISHSSGYAALDQEALDLLRRAQPFPALPDALPDARIKLDVPIRFSLR